MRFPFPVGYMLYQDHKTNIHLTISHMPFQPAPSRQALGPYNAKSKTNFLITNHSISYLPCTIYRDPAIHFTNYTQQVFPFIILAFTSSPYHPYFYKSKSSLHPSNPYALSHFQTPCNISSIPISIHTHTRYHFLSFPLLFYLSAAFSFF